MLFIAEDDDTYQPGKLTLTNCGAPPEFKEPPKPATKTLLVGWRRDMQDMVRQLDASVQPGSTLVLLSDQPSPEDRINECIDGGYDITSMPVKLTLTTELPRAKTTLPPAKKAKTSEQPDVASAMILLMGTKK